LKQRHKNLDGMGAKKIVLLSLVSLSFFAFDHTNFHRSLNIEGDVYIIIVKSDYELKVYDKEGWYATYPVVFGSKSLEDKMMEGDRKTPEGEYHVVIKKTDPKWDKMMLLDYPTKTDYAKFNERKAKGLIPKGAKIGNGIGIHGTWNHDEMAVDLYQNWTNGCISLKREDIEELYDLIPKGTKVIIQK